MYCVQHVLEIVLNYSIQSCGYDGMLDTVLSFYYYIYQCMLMKEFIIYVCMYAYVCMYVYYELLMLST